MSATRDKSQKITFVYSNLYSIYRKGVERAREGAIRESGVAAPSLAAEALTELATGRAQGYESGLVIKAGDARAAAAVPAEKPAQPPRVTPYSPAELLGKRVAKPAVLTQAQQQQTQAQGPKKADAAAVDSLKQNLQSLNDLQARLRFMLKELEDLIKE
jgi:hypothetical protein